MLDNIPFLERSRLGRGNTCPVFRYYSPAICLFLRRYCGLLLWSQPPLACSHHGSCQAHTAAPAAILPCPYSWKEEQGETNCREAPIMC